MEEERKRHKLIIVTPSGKEHELGFLSPCKNGVVIGATQTEEIIPSHLTVISNKNNISSHTPRP